MAEGRMLKKLVSTSRKLASLQTDSARLLWTWILPHADIAGRFSAEPDVIKGYIVPRLKKMTPPKIWKYLLDMAECKLIILYKVNGDSYLEVVKFHKFQSLRADREAGSEIPPPPAHGSTPGVAPEYSRLSKDKISKVKPSEDKYSPTSDELVLSELLLNLILDRKPNYKKPNLQAWAKHVDRMIRLDNRVPARIREVIQWCQADDFWMNNILSTEKLRKQFDKLELRMNKNGSSTKKTKLFPIAGKICGKQGCPLPAVYKTTGGEYDQFYCTEHMPAKVKELYV